jgi:hypothetical protein
MVGAHGVMKIITVVVAYWVDREEALSMSTNIVKA